MSSSAQSIVPQESPGALPQFLDLAAAVHPALAGKAIEGDRLEPGCIVGSKNNGPAMAELLHYWRQHYPEAGEPYWSVRSWAMMIWQPVFLAVIAVHGSGLGLDLQQLQQQRKGGLVAGFFLREEALFPGKEEDLIETAGRSVRLFAEQLFDQLVRLTRLKHLTARRLLADSLLGALRSLEHLQPGVGHSHTIVLSQRWLEAAGLAGESALIALPLPNGRRGLGLDRKACCMHYRRRDGDLCASCPKLKLPERLRRMQEELYTEADAG